MTTRRGPVPPRLSLVWGFVRSRPRPYVLATLLGVAVGGLALVQPLVIRDLIRSMSTHHRLAPDIELLAGLFIAAALLSALEGYILRSTGESLVHEVRTNVAEHVLRLPLTAFNEFKAGDLISRVTNDASLLQDLVTTRAADAAVGVLTMCGSLAIMAILDPVLLVCSMSTVLVAAVVIAKIHPRARRASVQAQRRLGGLSGALDRSLRAIRTVKINQAENRETARIAEESAAVRDAGLTIARFQASVDPIVNMAVQGSLIIVLGVGAARVANGAIPLGTLIAFIMYLTRVIIPIGELFRFTQELQRGGAANQRLREVLDLPVEPASAPQPAAPSGSAGARGAVSVVFEDVSFGYDPAAPVLANVNLTMAPGSCVAIVGPSGAGKTTLFNLLAGFYYPTSGRLLIDGVDTRDIPLPDLRKFMGMVEQDAPIMDGTIGDNVLYAAPESGSEDVRRALRRSGLEAWVDALPCGMDTPTGSSGSMLSGGERQRVAVARSLLGSPRLLLLDEVTSQLDSLSERDMRATIQACASTDCTVVVVAHRLSTVVDADSIVVLRNGTVEMVGPHSELVDRSTFYRSLVSAQFLDGANVEDRGGAVLADATSSAVKGA